MSKTKKSTLSSQLLEAVKGCGLNATALAGQCGVAQPILSRWINGDRGLNLKTADRLATFFDMKLTKPRLPKT